MFAYSPLEPIRPLVLLCALLCWALVIGLYFLVMAYPIPMILLFLLGALRIYQNR